MNANERGQYSVRRGERSGGSISFYDGDTGDLIAHIGEYTYFTSNPRWNDLTRSKHRISWQPKFLPTGRVLEEWLPEGELTPAALISALGNSGRDGRSFVCHIVELAGDREPSRTILQTCVEDLVRVPGQAEYWLVGDSEHTAREHYDAFHQHDAALRFADIDPTADCDLGTGLLRADAAEILFLHGGDEAPGQGIGNWPADWRSTAGWSLSFTGRGMNSIRAAVGQWYAPGASGRSCRHRNPGRIQSKPGNFPDPGGCWVSRTVGPQTGFPCLMIPNRCM